MRPALLSSVLGGGPSFPAGDLFTFSDDFNSGSTYARDRSGWEITAADPRGALNNVSSAGVMTFSDGFVVGQHCYNETGRIDGAYVSAVIGTSGSNYRMVGNISGERDHLLLTLYAARTRITIQRVVAGATTTLYDTGVLGSAICAVGDSLRMDYSWSGSTCTVTLTVAGARYPTGSTSWTTSASGNFTASGKVGTGLGFVADSWACGALTSGATVRMTKLHRIYQRSATDSTGTVPISGIAKGCTSLQFRLLQNGSLVTGWDWGQKSITGLTVNPTTGAFTATIAGIPQGTGYQIDLRDSGDNNARSLSRLFDVGAIWIVWGQSLAIGLFGGTGRTVSSPSNSYRIYSGGPATDQRYSPINYETEYEGGGTMTGFTSGNNNTSAGAFLEMMRQTFSGAIGVVAGGYGSQALANFLSSSSVTPYTAGDTTRTLWTNLVALVNHLGGFEGFIWSQGQEDAGRSYNIASFDATAAAAYKANFATYIAAVRALAGRTAAQCPVIIAGLGRLNPPSSVIGNYTADNSYDLFRKTQYELTSLVDNCHLSHTQTDLVLASSVTNEVHLLSTSDMGYTEDATRMAASAARVAYGAASDRRGPLPVSAARTPTTIAVTYDANGCTAITCAAAVAANVMFWTDNTYTTQLTPSSMSIGALGGGQIVVTWTFASTAAGNVVTSGKGGAYSTGGIYQDTANGLKGTLADGRSVLTWPIWAPIVTT